MSKAEMNLTTLVKGQSYTAQTTGILRGTRIYHAVTFVASRNQTPESFIRREGTPNQDRIFCVDSHGSVPMLVVSGSIRPAGLN